MHKFIGIWKYIGAFLGGAFILSAFSLYQKNLLGVGLTFEPKAFIVPVLFGGTAGLVISFFYSRLQDNQQQLTGYLDNIDNLVQIVSKDKRFLYVNNAWREALQYSPDEVKS